jgi:hypothetical protein
MMPAERLDHWLGDPQVRTHHRRRAHSEPATLWAAARAITLADTGTLGRLVRWRIPGTPPELAYDELFRRYPFTLLEEGETYSISGLCGRIWTLQRDYPRVGPDDFLGWSQPGTVRVLFGHWVQPHGEGAEIVSEARVKPSDRTAAIRLRALWAVVGPFHKLVGAEPLTLAVRRAEQS